MTSQLIHVSYVNGYVIHLRFADGWEGDVDLQSELDGEIFEPLKDLAFFRQVRLHPELHTATWPNGADLAPEFLYEQLTVPA